MKRYCGRCNICCSVMRIPAQFLPWRDTAKPAHELCEKISKGKCSIHKERPKPCRDFDCLWLQIAKRSKDFTKKIWARPENIKVIGLTTLQEGVTILRLKELEADILNFEDPSDKIIRFMKIVFSVKQMQPGPCRVEVQFYGQEEGGHELVYEVN